MATLVKVCGLTRPQDVDAARDAAYLGFVFFAPSPRNLSFEAAGALARRVRAGTCKVALTVDADDATLEALLAEVPIDMLQLHGRETPERVIEVKRRYGLPVMKAVGVAEAGDLAMLDVYALVADQILVDARPPKGSALPGGNGQRFDWTLLAGRRWSVPWMLAGGLTAETLEAAVRLTRARQVDVSSGVESSRGIKDPARIAAFLRGAAATGGTPVAATAEASG